MENRSFNLWNPSIKDSNLKISTNKKKTITKQLPDFRVLATKKWKATSIKSWKLWKDRFNSNRELLNLAVSNTTLWKRRSISKILSESYQISDKTLKEMYSFQRITRLFYFTPTRQLNSLPESKKLSMWIKDNRTRETMSGGEILAKF